MAVKVRVCGWGSRLHTQAALTILFLKVASSHKYIPQCQDGQKPRCYRKVLCFYP